MLKIALTPCFLYEDVERTVFGKKTLTYMENDMVRFLASKDTMPYLLPDLDFHLLENYLREADGFIIQGGNDLSPKTYNEVFLNKEKWPGDPYRDQFELKIIDWAFKNNKPLFGICRGFQILNAYFKGTLYQDIPTEMPSKTLHRDPVLYDKVHHQVSLNSESFLRNIYNKESLEVNSIHHQAIKKLGDELMVSAKSPDGIIEAFQHKEQSFCFAVQWHPEFSHTLASELDDPKPLLDYFLDHCRGTSHV